MTDHGCVYRSRHFHTPRRQLQIRRLWTRPYMPRTTGDATAYATSLARVRMLSEGLRYYNRECPRTARGFKPSSATLGRVSVSKVFNTKSWLTSAKAATLRDGEPADAATYERIVMPRGVPAGEHQSRAWT